MLLLKHLLRSVFDLASKMASANPWLAGVVVLAIIVSILVIIQLLYSAKLFKTIGCTGTVTTNSTLLVQIRTTENNSKYLSESYGPRDDKVFIYYSGEFETLDPDFTNEIIRTLKCSGRNNDLNTWWYLVPDTQGSGKYRLRSYLSGEYVTFTPENDPDLSLNYPVALFTYFRVTGSDLGTPLTTTGWFDIEIVSGDNIIFRSSEQPDYTLCTDETYQGWNYQDHTDFYYSPTTEGRFPLHPFEVNLQKTETKDVFTIIKPTA